MILSEAVRSAAARLAASGADAPQTSARLLAAQVLGIASEDVLLSGGRLLSPAERGLFEALVGRRMQGEPLAYILGMREFYGLDFVVSPQVLIPRPDTETVIEAVRQRIGTDARVSFADLGTGSGCIGLTLAVLYKQGQGLLVDMQRGALGVAAANAVRHDVAQRVVLLQADLRTRVARAGSLDLIVSNPPYVSGGEYAALEPHVRDFEPAVALTPGPTGLEIYPPLAQATHEMLRSGGLAAVEVGWSQAGDVAGIFAAARFMSIEIVKDLAGHDRVVVARRGT